MEFKSLGARIGAPFVLGSVFALLTSVSSHAADAEIASEVLIEESVVTASLLGSSDSESLGYANILSAEELTGGATTGLGEALDDFLGMSTTDFGSAVSRPTIRGLTGDKVRVLNNGVRSRDVSGLGADHSMDVDLFNIEQIEVVKGPASLLYTNGGIGGIVNVVDNTIANEDFSQPESVLGMETQSVNNGQVEFISHQSNIGGFNFTASFNHAEFENFEIPKGAITHAQDMHDGHEREEEHDDDHGDEHGDNHDEDPITLLPNSDYSKDTMRFGMSKVGNWGHIGASYSSNEGLYGVPFHSEGHGAHEGEGAHDEDHDADDAHEDHDEDEHENEHGHGGHDEHENERIFAKTESDIINLEGSLILDNGLLNSVEYHFRDTDYMLMEAHAEESDAHDDHDDHAGDGDHDAGSDHAAHGGPTVFTNEAQELGAVFDFSSDILAQKIAVSVVAEDTAIIGEEAFMNPVNTDVISLGYYVSREAGEFVIDFGVRHDWVDRSGSLATDEEHDGDEHENEEHDEEAALQYFNSEDSVSSYGLQIARPFNDQFTATLNFSSVEKAPAAVELFMNGAHLATGRYEVGNPNLDTERANSVELALDYSSDAFFGTLTVYSNDIDNYIYLQDETEEEHQEHVHEHDGLILANYVQQDAKFVGYEFEIGKVFQLAGGDLTLTYGLDSVSADFSDNSNVPRINPDRSIYQAAYARGSFDLKVVFKDVESQADIASYEEFTQGYSMLDVRASNAFTLSDDLTLNVSLFGSNLLNEIARNHSSFVKNEVPLPGRSYGLKFYAAF